MENRFLASRRAQLGENSARATRRSRYCSSWRWRLWLHQGAKGPSGTPDRPILARAPALGRSRGGLGSRSPPLLEAVVFRLFGSRWRRPVFGLSPVAGQPEVLGANQRRRGPGTQVIDRWVVQKCSSGPSNAPTAVNSFDSMCRPSAVARRLSLSAPTPYHIATQRGCSMRCGRF